jgi:hypothetical protein
MIETRKYICSNCGSTFEANANVVNPICTVCSVTHIENDGFKPKMEPITAQSKDIESITPTDADLLDFFENYENQWGGD